MAYMNMKLVDYTHGNEFGDSSHVCAKILLKIVNE